MFDSKLTFKLHYETVCQKAMQKLRFVMRISKKYRNPQTLRTIYFNYVRSKMMYAVQVWMPRYASEFEMFEKIQHVFLKFAARKTEYKMKFTDHDYYDISKHLNVPTIKSVWEEQQIVFIYKLINGMIDCNVLLSKIPFNVPNIRLRNSNCDQIFAYLDVNTNNKLRPRTGIYKMCSTVNDNLSEINMFNERVSTFKSELRKKVHKYE